MSYTEEGISINFSESIWSALEHCQENTPQLWSSPALFDEEWLDHLPLSPSVSPMIQWMLGLLWSYRTNVLINLTGILTRRQPETREEVWLSVPDTGDLPNTRVFSVDCYKIQMLTYLGRSFSFLLTDVCTGGAAAFVLADSDLLADSMLAV